MQVFVDYEHEIGHPGAEADAARVEEIRAMRTADGQGLADWSAEKEGEGG